MRVSVLEWVCGSGLLQTESSYDKINLVQLCMSETGKTQ